ncbi:hypothetical protein FOPG_06805 [Fusarium oxysporum f. sp. conglutinans race 2 54008]|uniref:Uncharacterized protein n=1 Tax=Fusarium oxysporum f. sp. conglutinans race 2 54008 TaxID=1089457 RepID=X0HS71_FUSOX|nr:hypothetical protein FOPG_06805 [Fusarium oxysporum f. sp. conglutinans race 2 54008]KAG6981562.1 hypothetical protein FocnCong_v009169 [Fusarium oxysporum f. sp. conglutinans]KAI8414475.1 hypothetical protein FOFC_04086 [Fusarium oxysporum]
MLPSTQPKRRGRPPKSSTLCGKLPGSKPRGRPRSTAPRIMSDKRIALTLGWRMRKFTMGKRVGDAARSVYRLSGQWPWDLVTGFVPKKWGVEILESLSRLFRIIHQNFTVHDHRNDFQFVKDYLRECVMKHNRRRPHLKNSDIRDACDYFADDNPARRDVIRRTMTRLRCSISTVVPEDEDGWQDYRGYDHFDDDDDDDDDDDEYVDIATPTKRSRIPSSPLLSPKRARTAESTEPRPQSITDITNSLKSLHAQKQKELEVETNSLDEITASIQAKEASRTNHVNAKIDRLTSDVKAYESKREKILKIRGFVEQQHEGMMMKADHLLQQYTSRLEECDKLIAQANADVLEELDQMARRDFDLEDEEKRLEGRVKEVLEEVRHCSVVGTLMRLGPGGMAKLLGRLEGNGVELVGMAESIMNETEE